MLVGDEELKSLEAASSEVMEIQQFVKLDDVDPIYFQTSYYSVAEDPGGAPMDFSARHASTECSCYCEGHPEPAGTGCRGAAIPQGSVLHTLYYNAEVREIAEYGKDDDLTLQPQEVQLAEQFMKQLTGKFEPEQFKDEYESRVESLIESKQAGQGVTAAQPHRKLAPVINLMDALEEEHRGAAGRGPKTGAEKKPPAAATGDEAVAQRKAPQRKRKAG